MEEKYVLKKAKEGVTKRLFRKLEKMLGGIKVFNISSEKFVNVTKGANLNCDCYSCQCDSSRCDCVCQQSCDAGPCYGGKA